MLAQFATPLALLPIVSDPNDHARNDPSLIARFRKAAATMNHMQIANLLVWAIGNAMDAQHMRDAEIHEFGQATDEAISDAEFYTNQACAWSVIATEHGLHSLETTPDVERILN